MNLVKLLITTRVSLMLNRKVYRLWPLMAIPLVLNGLVSSPKEESTSPQPTKKSEPTSTHGLDSELRRLLKDSNNYQVIQCRQCNKIYKMSISRGVCQNCLSLALASRLSESLKPTDGKKRASRKPKT